MESKQEQDDQKRIDLLRQMLYLSSMIEGLVEEFDRDDLTPEQYREICELKILALQVNEDIITEASGLL